MELIFPGLELARRLEAADAGIARAAADEVLDVAGGVAAFAGTRSPLTHAIGLGMQGPVLESDLDRVEAFFAARGAECAFEVCPMADPSLLERMGRRGYRIFEFNNVLVRRVPPETAPSPRVRITEDHELWARTLTQGFLEREAVEEFEVDAGRCLMRMPDTSAFLADIDGEPAAGGAACVQGALVTLFADSTLVRFRNRGLQKELIAARLRWAAERGCTLATAATVPGTASQWNYLRAGFQVAYSKVGMCR